MRASPPPPCRRGRSAKSSQVKRGFAPGSWPPGVVIFCAPGRACSPHRRGAIRNPNGVPERVWISVVDTAGNICGSFRTDDATVFSFDVHVQKARTAAFFSNNTVGFSSAAAAGTQAGALTRVVSNGDE